jgi:hypothetical protein
LKKFGITNAVAKVFSSNNLINNALQLLKIIAFYYVGCGFDFAKTLYSNGN